MRESGHVRRHVIIQKEGGRDRTRKREMETKIIMFLKG